MSTYRLPAREIPLDDAWDVLVAGGGPAGCAAAAAAARAGAKTLLVEACGHLGGMGTSGLVPSFGGYNDREKVIARGLAEDVRRALLQGMPHMRLAAGHNPIMDPSIDPEMLKRIYDEMILDHGAEALFETRLCGVEADGGGVDAVLLDNKAGLTACRAKVYVDCTGDGDLAAWAGAPFEKGDEAGAMQPATHCFTICNIDHFALATGAGVHFSDTRSPVHKALRSEKYPLVRDFHSCLNEIGPGVYSFNTGHIYDIDNTDPASLSQALVEGRKQAFQYHQAFTEHHPAFAASFLAATGSLLGVRETRRILGDYVLTGDDYRARRSFPDEICRNAYGIDIHQSEEEALALARLPADEALKKIHKSTEAYRSGESFGVPYRCLTPKGLRNVLVAGRCISADRAANGTTRIMPCCLNTGEAAGVAAAQAIRDHDADVHAVDTDSLRATLREHGAYLP